MLRDAEYFKMKIGGLDGAKDTGAYLIKLVGNKYVPEPSASRPEPEQDEVVAINGNGNGNGYGRNGDDVKSSSMDAEKNGQVEKLT